MRKQALRVLSIAVLLFAVCYLSWHLGRQYGENERGDYVYLDCRLIEGNIESKDEMLCDMFELNTPKAIKAFKRYSELYERVLQAIESDADKQDWVERYHKWEQRKLGL